MRTTTIRGLALALSLAAVAAADDAQPQSVYVPGHDVGKGTIEMPVEKTIAAPKPAGAGNSSNALPAPAEPPQSAGPETPRVAPGLVRWHADPDFAFAAARTSGKPVLLFQILGNLDDEFC